MEQSKTFLDVNLTENYGKLQFSIDRKVEAVSVNWENNSQFLTIYIFAPDGGLCAQIIGAAVSGGRLISTDKSCTSACCRSLSSSEAFLGSWEIEYAVVGEKSGTDVNLKISAETLCGKPGNPDEYDIVQSLYPGKNENPSGKKLWYAGDFHTHTIYSDGKMSREENNEIAKRQQLDFYVATDHNVFHYSWPKAQGIAVFPGIEITSDLGHINLLFSEKTPLEHRSLSEIEEESSFTDIIKEAGEYALVSVNHPFMPPWDFKAENFPLTFVKLMEIINDPTYQTSEEATKNALRAWNYLLSDGHRVVGVGGSDSHLKPEESYEGSDYPSLLGDPRNYLLAEGNAAPYLKKALANADVCVSRGENIELNFGGLKRENNNFSGQIAVDGCLGQARFQGSKLHFCWIFDGETAKVEKTLSSQFQTKIDENYHWLRIDVKDESDRLYGFTNPIFFNTDKKKPKLKIWKDLMEKMHDED